ncbi:MAG: multicopper oxidase family protein [Anaerolineae bacterium]|nr:multicopper oxidase family protein [Anaerolineae bacterium]
MNFTRREFLKWSGGLALTTLSSPLLAACQSAATTGQSRGVATPAATGGSVREYKLTAAVTPVDLGTGEFKAWTYNGQPVGPEIRVTEGDLLRVALINNLPDPTTIHWHGVPVPNAMDGVPDMPLPPIQPGETFTYEFVARPSGTYWYHPHVGYQLDQGLVGPLIIEPKQGPGAYDREYTLVLDDWVTVDGGGPAAKERRPSSMMGGMMGGGMMGQGMGEHSQSSANGPLTEPIYHAFTINGQVVEAAKPFVVKQGERVRLRLINAAAATVFGLRLAGHTLTLTHTDGRSIEPLEVDALWIGMGERYDVEFTAANPGRWALYAVISDLSEAVDLATFVYSDSASTQDSGDNLPENLRWNDYGRLTGLPEEALAPPASTQPDQTFDLVLSGGMMSPDWTINGKTFPNTDDLVVKQGQRVRLNYLNHSPMPHPMHLHGHFFEVMGSPGLHKDTVMVAAHMGQASIEFVANNPGHWMHHCHHLYHMEAGMMNGVLIT